MESARRNAKASSNGPRRTRRTCGACRKYAPRKNEIDPIFDEFGFEYATAGRIADQSGLDRMNEICRIKGRAGVGLLSALPVIDKRYGLPGLAEDVDSGRWIEADVKTPQGYTVTVVCVYVHAGNTDDPRK